MQEEKLSYGMVGLGTMGCNLVLNMSDHGFSVAGYDKNVKQTDNLTKLAKDKNIKAFNEIGDFVASLKIPRVIMLLVPAGPIVDAVINDLKPHIAAEDIIVDCGNSHFTDTQLRIDKLAKDHIHFMGLGVSGGETGARFGPSIMPGGDVEAFNKISPMLEAISAKINGMACSAYMGNGAAGHYVKMVHNGIEYALMQLIAESYHLLKQHGKLNNDQLHDVFTKWNNGRLQSFLIEITAAVFSQVDENTNERLIDFIKDTAKQKGTGAWMSQDAMAIGSAIPAIDAAVTARIMSSMRNDRIIGSKIFTSNAENKLPENISDFISSMEESLYAAFIITYGQGLAMLKQASDYYKYETDITTVASIWRGGCIIRAAILEDIMETYQSEPDIKNILNGKNFSSVLNDSIDTLRKTIVTGIQQEIPLPAMSACLSYFDGYKSKWLPANLIQAQRDFFGAHTYERLDEEGSFHTEWNALVQ